MTVAFLKFICCLFIIHYYTTPAVKSSTAKEFAVIAYYSGNATEIDRYPVEKLTHIIYSFAYLKDNRIYVTGQAGVIIKKLVSLKKRHPQLKVLIGMGGWGGCKSCSPVFSTAKGRIEFARSVESLLKQYNADGIDLDWEYPAIQGPIGHPFAASDKQNFTALIKALREHLGNEKEITFAAGAFTEYLQQSVEWQKVMPLVNCVHLMTYDLVNRNSIITGHHAALYSTSVQKESTNNAIEYLNSLGIPPNKMAPGIAFYARVFEKADSTNNGLYQPCKFQRFVLYKHIKQSFSSENGFTTYRDNEAKAPFSYNPKKKLFATYDDARSVREKTRFALDKGLYGIMFWELRQDDNNHTLLNEIYNIKGQFINQPAN